MRGKLITLEGGEGVGKTTHLAAIKTYLEQRGHPVMVTREPGGTQLGERLRALLLDHNESEALSENSELLLIFAARAQHIDQRILPALNAGEWVLCDRFTDASYAYQGGGRGISWQRIAQLEQWVQGELRPDLTLLLDAPVEVGMARARQRSRPDRFETEQFDFFNQVRTHYLKLAATFPERIKIVDASLSMDEVERAVLSQLRSFLSFCC